MPGRIKTQVKIGIFTESAITRRPGNFPGHVNYVILYQIDIRLLSIKQGIFAML